MNTISISLAFAIVLLNSIFGTDAQEFCGTQTCAVWVQAISKSLTQSIHPCTDFYEYVCGNRQDPGTWFRQTQTIDFQLSELISKIGNSNVEYLQKLKQYNNMCINDVLQSRNDEFKRILKNLGNWPILSDPNTWNEAGFNWAKLMRSFREVGFYFSYFVDFSISSSPRNRLFKVIKLDRPTFGIDSNILRRDFEDDTVKRYHRYIVNVAKILGAKGNYENELKTAVQFEIQLAKIFNETNQPRMQIMPVNTLQTLFPSNNLWLDYLNAILSPYNRISPTDDVLVANVDFFTKFSKLMTNERSLNRVLANYAFYRATLDLAYLLEPEIRTAQADFQNSFVKKPKESKFLVCARNANKDMYLATSALYIKSLNNFKKDVVEQFAKNIRDSFSTIIEEVGWINNPEMLQAAKDKISKMVLNIAYPNELTNNAAVSNHYGDLSINNLNYFNITLKCNLFNLRKALITYKAQFNKSDWTGPFGNAARLNSYYDSSNTLFVPVGDIQNLFGFDDPGYMNYAMLGFITGRNMGYAFSTINRAYDGLGKFVDMANYKNDIDCVLAWFRQYADAAQPINRRTILNNIIASVLSLKAAFHAYNTTFSGIRDKQLSGFPLLPQNQMFWISYASMFCNANFNYNIQGLSKYQVNGAISKVREFSSTFGCSSAATLNPRGKCDIWKNVQ